MSLSAVQINAIYAALFGPSNLPSAAQLTTWEALDATQGDAAVISGIVNSPASMELDYAVVQVIQFVSGSVPSAAQLQGWVAYIESGGSLTSVVNAFAASSNFQANFNNGSPVNVNAPVTATIMSNILFQALGTIPSQSQIQTWVNTGLSVAQVVAQFALGDQYSARTATFVQNYLIHIAAEAAGLPGAAAPSGSLFGVPADVTVTDNTVGKVTTAGDSITFTVNTIGVTAGTQESWTLTGTALGEVSGPTSGMVTIGTNGTASVTVNTLYDGLSEGSLTFSVSNITPPPADTVTVDAPAIIDFTTKVGEVLTGGPANTTFVGVVDTVIVGNNTMSNIVDSAQGAAGFSNTLEVIVDAGTNFFTIVPGGPSAEDTNIQTLEATDLSFGGVNFWNLQYMPQLQTIEDVGTNNSDDFFNVQNLVNVVVDNDDFPVNGFLTITVTNAVAGGPVSVTTDNGGTYTLTYQNTSGADIVTEFDFSVQGANHIDLSGAQVVNEITAAGTGSLWLHFNTIDNAITGLPENDLLALTFVDASGLSGPIPAGHNYQFGFDAVNIFNSLTFLGAQGNTFADLNLEVSHADGTPVPGTGGAYDYEAQGGTFDITTFGGNDWIRVNSFEGNGETINVNSGDGNTSSTNTGSGNGGDNIDLHGWRAVNQTLNVTSGDGNNTVRIVSADNAAVDVAQGNGNNGVTVNLWNGQETGDSNAVVTVGVGDGTNTIAINTDKTNDPYNDDVGYGKVTVTAGNGDNDNVSVTNGFEYTDNITLGNGNGDTVSVSNYGFHANTTITVGTGSGVAVNYSETNSAFSPWAFDDTVAINLGNLAGGDSGAGGTADVTLQNGDALHLNAGDGSYIVDVTLAEGSPTNFGTPGSDTVDVTMGNGNNDVIVSDGPGTEDTVNITLGGGNNDITVDLHENTDSTVTINAGSAATMGDNFVSVTLDLAGPASTATINTGGGNDTVEVFGVGANNVGINTGAGNDLVLVDSLTLPATLSANGGAGYDTLGLNDNAALSPVGVQVAANIQGFEALQMLGLTHDVDVLDLGPNNNINQVIVSNGYSGGHTIGGLNTGAELDLLTEETAPGAVLSVPIGNAAFNPTDTFNLLLDSQNDIGGGALEQHLYGAVDLNPTVGSGTVTTVNLVSTSFEGIFPSDPDDYAQVINNVALIDNGMQILNINGLGGGDPDAAVQSVSGDPTVGFGGTEDGDVYLNLNGSSGGILDLYAGLTALTTVNANTFTAGIELTDTVLGVGIMGELVATTFNAVNTTEDILVFGDHSGDVANLGNWDNSVTMGNGAGDQVNMTDTTNVYGSSEGGNTVSLGNGASDVVSLADDGNDSVTVGWGNSDTITLGAGSGSTVTIDGTTSHTPVDTVSFGAGNNNIVNPNFASGSTITFGAHTSNASNFETVSLTHIGDSTISLPDVIQGLANPATNGDHITFLPGGSGTNFDQTLVHWHLQVVASEGAINSALTNFTTSSTVHDIVFVNGDGNIYIDYNSGSHVAQMEVQLVGVSNLTLGTDSSNHITLFS